MENNRFIEDGKFKVRQFSADVCSIFEDLLGDYDIYIPSNDREGEEGEACLYGTEYSIVEDGVTEILVDLIEELKDASDVDLKLFSSRICDEFEGILQDFDIYIPSEDREGEEYETHLYGTERDTVKDGVAKILVEFVEEFKKNPDIEIDDEDY